MIHPARELKYAISRRGLNRTLVVRRLTHELSHPRLRALRGSAMDGSGVRARALRLRSRGSSAGSSACPRVAGRG